MPRRLGFLSEKKSPHNRMKHFGRCRVDLRSKNIRELGSTGMHTWPGRVFKGKKMSGQYGAKRTTVKNLRVVRVDAENNRLYLLGAVPGPSDRAPDGAPGEDAAGLGPQS